MAEKTENIEIANSSIVDGIETLKEQFNHTDSEAYLVMFGCLVAASFEDLGKEETTQLIATTKANFEELTGKNHLIN